jgi:two-component system, chemotaxis family, sensor kinase CheA
MSADRDPETLALFIEESQEALQRIDQQLVDAERGVTPDNLMASLFRDIHTMKGSAGFLDFGSTTRLAHVTEDLLAKLRDGALAAGPEHFSLLLKSVDLLRQFLDSIKEHGDEAALDIDELVTQLRAAMTVADAPAPTPTATASEPVAATSEELSPAMTSALLQGAPAKTDDKPKPDAADGTVRVNVGVLDNLMNLIGELVLARNQMVQIVKNTRDANVNAQAACQRLSLVTSDLQEQIMKTRMQPMARVLEKIPRMVRDLCQQTGKRVNAVIEGNTTEIDKALIEAIRDPLLHIVRNAVDHGIEFAEDRIRNGKSAIGKLIVRAVHEGGAVMIEIRDDGKGMDPAKLRSHAVDKGLLSEAQAERLSDREALELVFRPGFSTAAKVTDLSGRGVGMDVVRTHIERAGGQVELDSVVGKGTTIRLKMPLTLAIIPALLVRCGAQRFAIPQVNLLELVYLDDEQVASAIEIVRGSSIYRLRGEVLPLVFLHEMLKVPAQPAGGINIVVVAIGTRRYGIVVDDVHDTEEIVIKPLSGQLKRIPAYSGATVLGDGGVALILEVAGLATMSGMDVNTQRRAEASGPGAGTQQNTSGPQPHVVFTSGEHGRCAVPLSMVSRLENIPTSSIEIVAGQEVVQYRGNIMPIIRPESVLPLGSNGNHGSEQPLIVFDFGYMAGMAVNSIIDVTDVDRSQLQQESNNPLVQGRAVVMGATTLFLDVYAIVRQLAPHYVKERRQLQQLSRVLLVDHSNAMRTATSMYLQNAGVDVIDVSSIAAATKELSRSELMLDAIICDIEFADGSGYELLQTVQAQRSETPCILWTLQEGTAVAEMAAQMGVCACINKLSREQLLMKLETLGVIRRRRSEDHTLADIGDRSAA